MIKNEEAGSRSAYNGNNDESKIPQSNYSAKNACKCKSLERTSALQAWEN